MENNLLKRIKILNPIWLTISEAAKLSGVNNKTIRRAILSNKLKYKIIKSRYFVDLSSTIKYLYSNTKLTNKINTLGIGQYIDKWYKYIKIPLILL